MMERSCETRDFESAFVPTFKKKVLTLLGEVAKMAFVFSSDRRLFLSPIFVVALQTDDLFKFTYQNLMWRVSA